MELYKPGEQKKKKIRRKTLILTIPLGILNMLITKVETTLFSGDMDKDEKKIAGHTGGITREEINS